LLALLVLQKSKIFVRSKVVRAGLPPSVDDSTTEKIKYDIKQNVDVVSFLKRSESILLEEISFIIKESLWKL
jgi:hypothetical protein